MSASNRPLAVIAFDAAEISMIERGIAEGWLPNLARLREAGAMVSIRSESDIMVGTVWPSFYTGRLPPEHGIFGVIQWRPDHMQHERPDSPDWLQTRPFYRGFGEDGPRVLVIDMPFAPTATPFNGREIVSWNAHATMGPRGAFPADLAQQAARAHGAPLMRDEIYGPQTPAGLLRLRDRLVASTAQQSALARDLAARGDWDLFLLGFGAVHRAGHKLQTPMMLRSGAESDDLRDALRQVYVACDAAIGEVVENLPLECHVILFSLNGMVPNTSHHFLLPEMLRRILEGDSSDTTDRPLPRPPLLHRLREAVPLEWRSAVKEGLPGPVKDRLGRFWRSAEARDWSQVRAFRLVGSDFEGQIQINLKGRERDGIVEPGAEYEALCDRIAEGLPGFVDADTGAPVIARVLRPAQLWPDAQERQDLPDLLAQWAGRSAVGLRALRSDRYGAFLNRWQANPPDGRSGHHQPQGWAMARGPGDGNETLEEHSVQDLAATIHAHFGLPTPAGTHGAPISALLRGEARP
ncbi:alkaline phosphatase family protein [Tropicimonas aquimaris]|uniref:Alkaline phosphatase family protein n=1 Tax=Tropicimonas aquimaris TaxID=914152 RepID=A0ABW3IYD0_9RHOB